MQDVTEEESLHENLIKRVAVYLMLSISALVILRLSLGTLHYLATATAIVAISSLGLVRYLTGKSISSFTAAWLIVIIFWSGLCIAGYAAGGLDAPVIIAFPLVPLTSALLINRHAAIVMGILAILAIVTYAILGATGYALPTSLNSHEISAMRGAWLIFIIFLVAIIGWYYSRKNEILTQTLKAKADTDFLTNLANRRAIDIALTREFSRARRNGSWLSLLLVDVDHFKNFNDEEGHKKGDECLVLIARQISNFCHRATDISGRYGGEEFVLVLPDTDPADASMLAEKLRQTISSIKIDFTKKHDRKITITTGCASIRNTDFDHANDLIEFADQLLYQGKTAGRNIVVSEVKDNTAIMNKRGVLP